ncbi:hypothetical protein KR018_008124 [Drosophila ironensis]|nr:hypothetical protein KR018_008124 [Drosophila ironensis]
MPERLKELHLTVSWTHSKSQIQIKIQTQTQALEKIEDVRPCSMLNRAKRLTLNYVFAELIAFPNKHLYNNKQQQYRFQLHTECPLIIKFHVPAKMDSFQKQVPKTSNDQQPAMHRKSKSKSKIIDFKKFSLVQSLKEEYRTSVNQPSSLEDTVNTCEVRAVRIGVTKSKQCPDVKKTARGRLYRQNRKRSSSRSNLSSTSSVVRCKMLIPMPTLGVTSLVTLFTLICIETVLLSTMSSCAKTFYMHWNTSNSIFRIDNTDHIIDVNKGNLAFEFDQVHIICPVYEPGTFENETEKYIIYNVSKVEYETCRITNADPRVIAICDKPQKLMFFTITFRPFTPQPGGLEFLPGNDYYFISTSSKDDLYRRIGGRCSTNNMKVVFKVCCATEEKNKTTPITSVERLDIGGTNNEDVHSHMHGHVNNIGIGGHIGISGVNSGLTPGGPPSPMLPTNGNIDININGIGPSINSNLDQFNRIPVQTNIIGNSGGSNTIGSGIVGGGGIILTPGHGHGSINMLQPGRGGVNIAYPGHHHIQTGIRINNVPTQHAYPPHKSNVNSNVNGDNQHYDKHPNEVVKNEELTYNSGSTHANPRIFGLWIWFFSWMVALPLSANWIDFSLVLSIVSILGMHFIVGKALLSPKVCRQDKTVFTPSCTKLLRSYCTTPIRYDRPMINEY